MSKRFNPVKKSIMKDTEKTAIFGCMIIIITFIVSLFIYPAIEMWLWNKFLVDLFPTIHIITYWQMFGINWLCSLLFKTRSSKTEAK